MFDFNKTKISKMEAPEFIGTSKLPENKQELHDMLERQAEKDKQVEEIFDRAEKAAEAHGLKNDISDLIEILRLSYREATESRKEMWRTSLLFNRALEKMDKAITALNAATDSSHNIVDGISSNIAKAWNTPMPVKLTPEGEQQLQQHRDEVVKKGKDAMDNMHAQTLKDIKNYNTQLQKIRVNDRDNLWIHGKLVMWVLYIALSGFVLIVCLLVVALVMFIKWLAT